jgi:hypothetical protein
LKSLLDIEKVQGETYNPNGGSDVWDSTAYINDVSSAGDNIKINLEVSDFSQSGANPVVGKLAILHDVRGNPIACGVILDRATYPG